MKIALVIAAVLYVLMPYDLLPDLLAGWGWLDDLIIIGLLWRYLFHSKKPSLNGWTRIFGKEKQTDGASRQRFNESNSQGQHDSAGHRSPYDVLGVPNTATMDEIKSAYRKLAAQYHPDKVAHLGDEFRSLAENRFKEIQQAYQEIVDKQ